MGWWYYSLLLFACQVDCGITTVKELMGHKDIKMTLRYAHLAPKHKADSVEKLNGVLTTGQKLAKIRGAGNHKAS